MRGFLTLQSPRARTSLLISQRAARTRAGWSSGSPDSLRATTVQAVSHTGEVAGCSLSVESSSAMKSSSPRIPRTMTGWSAGYPRALRAIRA